MKTPGISQSEWFVMECLWDSSPQTAAEAVETLRPSQGWAQNTVRTLLTRLVKKKALKVATNQAGIRTFRPAVSRKSCVKAESDSFVKRIFGGATKPLLMHFVQESRFSAEEVEELKHLLDKSLKP